jgi:hypothetical protein
MHPLWLAVCTVAFALTRDVFYTAIAVGIVLTHCEASPSEMVGSR